MASAVVFRSGFRRVQGLVKPLLGSSSLDFKVYSINKSFLQAFSPRSGLVCRAIASGPNQIESDKNANLNEHHNASEELEETVEEHEMTVYKGILSTQIKLVKSFSLMTSMIGLSCQPLLFLKASQATGTSLAIVVGGGAFLSFFTFATPLLIHFIAKKYVTELLYNKIEDTYTAVTYSFLLRRKEVHLVELLRLF